MTRPAAQKIIAALLGRTSATLLEGSRRAVCTAVALLGLSADSVADVGGFWCVDHPDDFQFDG